MNESAGRSWTAGTRHGNKWLSSMLVEAAGSVSRMHGSNYLAEQHQRLAARRGAKRAQVAIAHSILFAVYHMLTRDEPYRDLGPTGTPAATTRPTPAGSCSSWRSSATPSTWIQPPDPIGGHPADGTPSGGDDARPVVTYSRAS